ncbi:MAG: hypothetical protein R3336_04285, partial [Phycisphaeraceae bacterium]|nr:hypothetical protein [Phycisphaeraceae bacterium]
MRATQFIPVVLSAFLAFSTAPAFAGPAETDLAAISTTLSLTADDPGAATGAPFSEGTWHLSAYGSATFGDDSG